MRVSSNGESKYFITFTDDCTRWTEVRLIKSKDQALEEFKAFKALVEKQHDAKIKTIQSDNGREYINKEFDEYLKEQGIRRQLTTAYTPEQNGVAERKNRTLVDSARCLLLQSGLPPSFWAEAIATANYIRNRCPTKKLDGRTPHEAWKGNTPVVSHFREFGCKVFCLDKTFTRGKFDAKSKEGIFIGYAEQSKGFRIWLPESKKIEITRDVRFLENNSRTPKVPSEDFYPEGAPQDRPVD
ncbi:retrotransposon unclassified [Lasius niger]|uniref:Retrotransposon unclassified n=1 Tax=Lasius niger TaxID=67767 RepID=A0A0J7KGV0_LASNI|nr:retrotransposon unclassified [Lasius niger]